MIGLVSSSKTTAIKKEAVTSELRFHVRSVVNEINGSISRLLVVCETKEKDKAAKQVIQTLEIKSTKQARTKSWSIDIRTEFVSSLLLLTKTARRIARKF